MAKARLIGGSALRARLTNVAAVAPAFAGEWADETVDLIKRTKPSSTRPASSRFTAKVSDRRAGVYGAFWWIFVDRGTKAHDIVARRAKTLVFQWKGDTIFAKKVHRKRMRRRPFITRAAQEALSSSNFAELVIQAWNGRRIRGRSSFL